MNPQTNNGSSPLTIGSLRENIWSMSWPMLIIMTLNFLVGITDIYVAGMISPEIQAAVGYVSQLYFFIIILANAISIGTIALISRAAGAGNRQEAVEIAKQSVVFSFFTGVLLALAGYFLSGPVITLSGFPESISAASEKFLKIFSVALGANYILIVSNAVFRASGEVKKPLFTMCIVSAINIAGDFLLVFGTGSFSGIGYTGIAISTSLSVTAGMFINFGFFATDKWKAVYQGKFNLSAATIKRIVSIGWPSALLQIAWNAGSIIIFNILGRLGEASITAIAAISNGLRIEAIIYLPAFALNMSASVLVGQNLGARNIDRAVKAGWKIALAGALFISSLALIMFISANELASVFTQQKDVYAETARYLRFNMLSEPFMALSIILAGALQGAGDTKGAMWVIITAMWLIRLPLAYMLAVIMEYGAAGVWTAMVISMTTQGLLMTLRFHKGKWHRLKI